MKTTATERTVVFGHVNDGEVIDTLAVQHGKDNFAVDSIAKGVPKFTQEKGYTTFLAEYVLRDGDLVIHFFLPPDFKAPPAIAQHYWEIQFARALDAVAQEVFQATAPRLQAKYTEEMKSWWFRACNYDHIIDVAGFVRRFFDELDTALEAEMASSRATGGA